MIIGVLGFTLTMSVVACPLWMSSLSQSDAPPCPEHSSSPEPCPLAICEASSSYLASQVSTHVPLLVALAAEAVDSTIIWTQPDSANFIQSDDGSPPGLRGPLFLQTHSLLI